MTLLIKKYKNRRLYDTQKSQYITIEDVHAYVLDGIAFQVIDAASNADITKATLLQILVEMEGGGTPFFSADILRQFICLAHHPMHQVIKNILGEMISALEQQAQSNVFVQNYKKMGEAWNKELQQLANHWQSLFK